MLRERTTMWASGVPRNWTNLSICQIDQLKMWYAYTDKIKADSLNNKNTGYIRELSGCCRERCKRYLYKDIRRYLYREILGISVVTGYTKDISSPTVYLRRRSLLKDA